MTVTNLVKKAVEMINALKSPHLLQAILVLISYQIQVWSFFSMDGNQTTSHAKKRKSDESLLINNPDEVKGVAMEALEPSSTA
jgi:hypothetical protein